MVWIEIDNSPDFIFSDTCQTILSFTFMWSPTSTEGKKCYPDNTLSDEDVSVSVPNYLWRGPPYINGVLYVKIKHFLLVSIIHTSNYYCFYFWVHFPFKLISTAVIITKCCLWRLSFMDVHILLVCSIFIRYLSYFSPFTFTPYYFSCAHW